MVLASITVEKGKVQFVKLIWAPTQMPAVTHIYFGHGVLNIVRHEQPKTSKLWRSVFVWFQFVELTLLNLPRIN